MEKAACNKVLPEMIILQIEHKVSNFEGWKIAFDNDPVGRKKAGVKRYRVTRPVDDPNFVIVDLEFENGQEAQQMLTALRKLRTTVEGTVMFNP